MSYKGTKQVYKKGNPSNAPVQDKILEILRQGRKHSTKEISKATGLPHSSVYNACRSLEKKGLINSKKEVGGQIWLDLFTGEVLTTETYDRIMGARDLAMGGGQDIPPIIPIGYYVRYWWV